MHRRLFDDVAILESKMLSIMHKVESVNVTDKYTLINSLSESSAIADVFNQAIEYNDVQDEIDEMTNIQKYKLRLIPETINEHVRGDDSIQLEMNTSEFRDILDDILANERSFERMKHSADFDSVSDIYNMGKRAFESKKINLAKMINDRYRQQSKLIGNKKKHCVISSFIMKEFRLAIFVDELRKLFLQTLRKMHVIVRTILIDAEGLLMTTESFNPDIMCNDGRTGDGSRHHSNLPADKMSYFKYPYIHDALLQHRKTFEQLFIYLFLPANMLTNISESRITNQHVIAKFFEIYHPNDVRIHATKTYKSMVYTAAFTKDRTLTNRRFDHAVSSYITCRQTANSFERKVEEIKMLAIIATFLEVYRSVTIVRVDDWTVFKTIGALTFQESKKVYMINNDAFSYTTHHPTGEPLILLSTTGIVPIIQHILLEVLCEKSV